MQLFIINSDRFDAVAPHDEDAPDLDEADDDGNGHDFLIAKLQWKSWGDHVQPCDMAPGQLLPLHLKVRVKGPGSCPALLQVLVSCFKASWAAHSPYLSLCRLWGEFMVWALVLCAPPVQQPPLCASPRALDRLRDYVQPLHLGVV